MAEQESQPQEHDFRVRNALGIFTDYADRERARRENADEYFDPALHDEAVALVTSWLRHDEGGDVA